MSKGREKAMTKLIPRIYKRNAENMMMFSCVRGQMLIVPTITLEQSIWNYFKLFDIEDWDMECAKSTYCRIQKEYYEDCKS